MVFPIGQRDANVITTGEYCSKIGKRLRKNYLSSNLFDEVSKKTELKEILGIGEKSDLIHVGEFSSINNWGRFGLETSDNKIIPVLLFSPSGAGKEFIIIVNPLGKKSISPLLIEGIIGAGKGIAIVDLSGTGEASSTSRQNDYSTGKLRTISKSELWFGRTMLGEWVKELIVVKDFLHSRYLAERIQIDGSREAALAGLFLGTISEDISNIILRDAPVSYLFDNRESVDYYSMAIHLPGILNWGDISLAAALSGKSITFINPLTISGQKITDQRLKEYQEEFEKIRSDCKLPGETIFK